MNGLIQAVKDDTRRGNLLADEVPDLFVEEVDQVGGEGGLDGAAEKVEIPRELGDLHLDESRQLGPQDGAHPAPILVSVHQIRPGA